MQQPEKRGYCHVKGTGLDYSCFELIKGQRALMCNTLLQYVFFLTLDNFIC